ncbi:MAG: RluA family pseudouridine synthase [Flavobacteriales bacterium]|nr:RluA family pseudouridine synthase [Flavobacteriales bacterium]
MPLRAKKSFSPDELPEPENDDELFEHHRFVADPGQGMMRIDKFLVIRLEKTSRTRIQDAHDNGFVRVNGIAAKSNYKVKPLDVITIELPYPVRELELIPENIPLDILFEDHHVIVLIKPAQMVVHPAYGHYSGTLVNAVLGHIALLPKGSDDARPGLVHRLDKNTTGVMVIAKTDEALTHLSKQFFNRTTGRTYEALVWGEVEGDGTVTGHVGRNLKDRKVMDVFPDGSQGKPATTHYKVLERFGYVTLVECKLETGRTHQIRVHMKHIGHTLFNDDEYGGDKILKGTTFSKYRQFVENCFALCPRQALHAKSLSFEHPVTGQILYFQSELPNDMKSVLDKWRRYTEKKF